MFNDFSKLGALMNTSHLFSEHPQLDGQNLRQAGPIQYLIHWFYGVFEPPILRAVDILLTRKWIKDTAFGRFLLKQIARLSWYFPHGLIVTTEAAGRMVDFVINTEGPKGARIAVGPCVCQRAIGTWQEPCKKDMVVLYGADIYTHLNLGYELIDGDQAKALLKQYAAAGLVHSIDFCMQSGKWTFVICSCDTEICVPARIYLLTGRFFTLDRKRLYRIKKNVSAPGPAAGVSHAVSSEPTRKIRTARSHGIATNAWDAVFV